MKPPASAQLWNENCIMTSRCRTSPKPARLSVPWLQWQLRFMQNQHHGELLSSQSDELRFISTMESSNTQDGSLALCSCTSTSTMESSSSHRAAPSHSAAATAPWRAPLLHRHLHSAAASPVAYSSAVRDFITLTNHEGFISLVHNRYISSRTILFFKNKRHKSARVSMDQGQFAKVHQGFPSRAFLFRSGSLLHLH